MSDSPWKLWTALAAVVLAVGIGVWRWQREFNGPAPDWLRQRTFRSPALAAPVLRHFLELRRLAEFDAVEAKSYLASLQFIEVGADQQKTFVWTCESFSNQGFQPLAAFERTGGRDEKLFRGYYTLAGEPLEVTVKHHPARRDEFFLTVHVPEPVAPGATVLALRVESRPNVARKNEQGDWQVGLSQLTGSASPVHLRGVCLPEQARLVQYRPADSALVLAGSPTAVGWVSTRLTGKKVTPSVVYRNSSR